jgi:hypothetical protein
MPAPELRTGFALPNLDTWILDPANQRRVLFHLLVLVLDWTRAGAPSVNGPAMRQFTPWAKAVGGFLAHHGIPGFLANTPDAAELDDDAAEWGAFLARWHALHGTRRFSANELRRDAEPQVSGFGPSRDPWDGLFPTGNSGHLPTAKSLGRLLTGQIGRWRGSHVLRSATDSHSNARTYWVEHRPESLTPRIKPANPQSRENGT